MMPPLNSLSARLSAWTLATVAATTLLTAISTPVFAQTSSPAISLSPAIAQTTQTAPVNGNFIAPANVSLTATATAASGSSINQVQFYQGNTLIGTSNNPTTPNSNSYSVAWSNVPANSYVITAKATDSLGNTSTSAPATVNVINNNPPAVSLTASPSKAVVPATILLNATATASDSDSDGSISKVDVLNGNNVIASLTQPPYSTQWTNVAAGTYSLTATATDNLGATTTSAPVSVTVAGSAAQVYDIHTDQLNTPRVITDKNGNAVWRWDSAPFGESLPDENPMHSGAENDFRFNLRFPGQYYDEETGLHYNYFRDYDPTTGRYAQSDPIGLQGGINTYGYVGGNPLSNIDPEGLQLLVIRPKPKPPIDIPGDIPLPAYKPNNGDDCGCKSYTDVYDSGRGNEPKHGSEQRGDSSAEPANPVLALQILLAPDAGGLDMMYSVEYLHQMSQ